MQGIGGKKGERKGRKERRKEEKGGFFNGFNDLSPEKKREAKRRKGITMRYYWGKWEKKSHPTSDPSTSVTHSTISFPCKLWMIGRIT